VLGALRLRLLRMALLSSAGVMPNGHADDVETTVAAQLSRARAVDGSYISWREHLIDDESIGGVANLDGDGYQDIVSVHESDVEYDGVADGHIRIAFGSPDPDRWELVTLAEGVEAGAAEDAAIGDVNGDGWLDIIAACELAHLIYFENPRTDARHREWQRIIPTVTTGRGSFIRVFLEDFDGDGLPEVATANKGAQDPTRAAQEPKAISVFTIDGDPLDDDAWREHVLTEVPWPINAQPVDLDSDGDTDIIGGSVAEGRIMWFENVTRSGAIQFVEHPITIAPDFSGYAGAVNGFNMDFADFNGDGRLDIATFDTNRLVGVHAVWLEAPTSLDDPWRGHLIGEYAPDALVGFAVADVNGDGLPDLMTGGYSLGSRTADGLARPADSLGRLAWFENLGPGGTRWARHDFSRRERGMFDKFIARDMDDDGDLDFVSTRGNSGSYDGVFWLEQRRAIEPQPAFVPARREDSPERPLP
jgi:FG-GAP-like repeat